MGAGTWFIFLIIVLSAFTDGQTWDKNIQHSPSSWSDGWFQTKQNFNLNIKPANIGTHMLPWLLSITLLQLQRLISLQINNPSGSFSSEQTKSPFRFKGPDPHHGLWKPSKRGGVRSAAGSVISAARLSWLSLSWRWSRLIWSKSAAGSAPSC